MEGMEGMEGKKGLREARNRLTPASRSTATQSWFGTAVSILSDSVKNDIGERDYHPFNSAKLEDRTVVAGPCSSSGFGFVRE